MAQLKDTTITGDLSVSGKVTTATHRDNIDSANIIKVEFAKLLDPTVLNEEVTLATIPLGYVGRLSHMGQVAQVGYTYYQSGSVSSNATVSFYFTPQTTGTEISSEHNDFDDSTAGAFGLNPFLAEDSTLRAKITVAGVGHTSKILVEGVIYLQKI